MQRISQHMKKFSGAAMRTKSDTWYRNRPQRWKRSHPQPEWMSRIQRGDVLRKSGKGGDVFRVVRRAVKRPDGELYSLMFVKRARSEYSWPVTIYYAEEIIDQGWQLAGVRAKLDKEIDARIDCSIEKHFDCPTYISQSEAIGLP
jgi:hypothetical protein